MGTRNARWAEQKLDVVGVLAVHPDVRSRAVDPTLFRELLVAADQAHPWASPLDEGGELPSIASLEGPDRKPYKLGRHDAFSYEFRLQPPVYLRFSQLIAYDHYLEEIAQSIALAPEVGYVRRHMDISTQGGSASTWHGGKDPEWLHQISVSLWGNAFTSDGEPVQRKADLLRIVRADPASVTIKPTQALPEERDHQIKIVGHPIDELTTQPFNLEALPAGVVLHVQSPGYYTGGRQYTCTIWRSGNNRLRTD